MRMKYVLMWSGGESLVSNIMRGCASLEGDRSKYPG